MLCQHDLLVERRPRNGLDTNTSFGSCGRRTLKDDREKVHRKNSGVATPESVRMPNCRIPMESIKQQRQCSPRGSITSPRFSPRGSVTSPRFSPRGSVTSPRFSPRGSVTSPQHSPRGSMTSPRRNFANSPYRWYLAVLKNHLATKGPDCIITFQELWSDAELRRRLRETGLRTDPFVIQCLLSVSLDILEQTGFLVSLGYNAYVVNSLDFDTSKYTPLLSTVQEDGSDELGSASAS